MKITKLLALILSFQASVQAVTLKDLYRQYTKEHKTQDAAAIETKLEQLKKLGISLHTRIVEKLEEASSLAEKYVCCLVHGTELEESILAQIKILQELGINLNTKIVAKFGESSSLAEQYVSCITGESEIAKYLAEIIEKELRQLKEWGIASTVRPVGLWHEASTLAEKFYLYAKNPRDKELTCLVSNLQTLKELGIAFTTRTVAHYTDASSLAEKYVWCLDSKVYAAYGNSNIKPKLQTLKKLNIDLNTPLKKTEEGTIEEKLVYRLHNNLSIDVLVQELNKKRAPLAQEEVKDAPSKKVKKDDSVCEQKEGVVLLPEKQERKEELPEINEEEVEKGPSKKVKQDDSVPLEQNAGVILLPEKQERKEELPEMNEEENGSPKRRHPDSKSE